MNKIKKDLPWVLLNVAGNIYAISCESVLSLFQIGKVTPVPKAPKEIRGVINFRGQMIQLIDIRNILNLKTIEEEIKEFEELMDERQKDHENWVAALEKSVKDKNEFTLTTDPHKCAFGKWYDSFDTKSNNIMFLMTYSKFDKPHKAIHAIADEAKKLMASGDLNGALGLIENTRNTDLKQMIHLFDDIKEAFRESKREIIVVLGDNTRSISLAVDEITAIEHLKEIDEELIKETMTNTEFMMGTGKRKDDSPVFLLNDDLLIKTFLDKK